VTHMVSTQPARIVPSTGVASTPKITAIVKSANAVQTKVPSSPIPSTLYITVQGSGKVKRKTLHFRAIHKKKGYWVGKNAYLFYAETSFGVGFVLSKLPPDYEDPILSAYCCIDGSVPVVPPFEGWKSEKWTSISIVTKKPQDWAEGDSSEKKEKIAKLFAAVRKERNSAGDFSISIKDVCRNIEAVKEYLPELLTDFPKIDHDGNGKVSLEELDAYFDPQKKKEYSEAKLNEVWGILTSRRDDQAKYVVGEELRAMYPRFYEATIEELNADGSVLIRWGDNDLEDRVKTISQIRKSGNAVTQPLKIGDAVEAEYQGWYRATIAAVNDDGSYTVNWADGDMRDRIKQTHHMRKTKKPKVRYVTAVPDRLDLEDLAANIDYVEDKVPELFESFNKIDVYKSCSIRREDFDAFFGSADVWLQANFQSIIGLGDLKNQIEELYWQQRLDRLRRRGGLMVNSDEAIVIMLKGSPGTGKTTIGRLLAGLLFKIGVIPTENFIECQRDDLVGDHLGATEKLTAAKIEEARGGVLFVDEAYRLRSDIFGVEAINGLMKAMTVKGTVMILAGYPKLMDEFVTANPGLKRRITYELEFKDYEPDDLAKILKLQIEKRGFEVDVPLEKMSELIRQSTNDRQRTMLNGGIGEHISRHAIFNLNKSQVEKVKNMKKGDAVVPSVCLGLEDIQFGCRHIPDPPDVEPVKVPPASVRAA